MRRTKDYPQGVWSLPPDYRVGKRDRAKYEAIGALHAEIPQALTGILSCDERWHSAGVFRRGRQPQQVTTSA